MPQHAQAAVESTRPDAAPVTIATTTPLELLPPSPTWHCLPLEPSSPLAFLHTGIKWWLDKPPDTLSKFLMTEEKKRHFSHFDDYYLLVSIQTAVHFPWWKQTQKKTGIVRFWIILVIGLAGILIILNYFLSIDLLIDWLIRYCLLL